MKTYLIILCSIFTISVFSQTKISELPISSVDEVVELKSGEALIYSVSSKRVIELSKNGEISKSFTFSPKTTSFITDYHSYFLVSPNEGHKYIVNREFDSKLPNNYLYRIVGNEAVGVDLNVVFDVDRIRVDDVICDDINVYINTGVYVDDIYINSIYAINHETLKVTLLKEDYKGFKGNGEGVKIVGSGLVGQDEESLFFSMSAASGDEHKDILYQINKISGEVSSFNLMLDFKDLRPMSLINNIGVGVRKNCELRGEKLNFSASRPTFPIADIGRSTSEYVSIEDGHIVCYYLLGSFDGGQTKEFNLKYFYKVKFNIKERKQSETYTKLPSNYNIVLYASKYNGFPSHKSFCVNLLGDEIYYVKRSANSVSGTKFTTTILAGELIEDDLKNITFEQEKGKTNLITSTFHNDVFTSVRFGKLGLDVKEFKLKNVTLAPLSNPSFLFYKTKGAILLYKI